MIQTLIPKFTGISGTGLCLGEKILTSYKIPYEQPFPFAAFCSIFWKSVWGKCSQIKEAIKVQKEGTVGPWA